MERAIVGYRRDDDGEWVAELACGHGQHVRHRPPFQLRPWVLEAEGRDARLGSTLDCLRCDRAELPDGLELVRSSADWDETTVPAGLQRAHRLPSGTWGQIVVRRGALRFTARTEPVLEAVVEAGSPQAIPPELEHDVQPVGPVSFRIDFFAVVAATRPGSDEGGEAACLLPVLCPDCGAVLDGGAHRPDCTAGHAAGAGRS